MAPQKAPAYRTKFKLATSDHNVLSIYLVHELPMNRLKTGCVASTKRTAEPEKRVTGIKANKADPIYPRQSVQVCNQV